MDAIGLCLLDLKSGAAGKKEGTKEEEMLLSRIAG